MNTRNGELSYTARTEVNLLPGFESNGTTDIYDAYIDNSLDSCLPYTPPAMPAQGWYYAADVVGANDYYPFGSLMPGRKFSSDSYRYGFNGKEKDNEVSGDGNQYDYGFRIYNPRLGKFLSVDPLSKSYPWYTPYQFAGNKPTRCVDLDGLEELSVSDKNEAMVENLAPSIWNNAINGLDNIVSVGIEAFVTDEKEGQMVRRQLERKGLNVGAVSNKMLGQNFKIRFDNREPVVVPESGVGSDLLDVVVGVLDVSTILAGPAKGGLGADMLLIEVSPLVKKGVADVLRGLKINSRTNEILKTFVDSKTGKGLKDAEASAGAIFEESTLSGIRPAAKNEAGDFIGTSGKFLNKSIDHIGGYMPGKNNMKDFFNSLTNHFRKADAVILDLRNFSESERKSVLEYINSNHSSDLKKIITIQ